MTLSVLSFIDENADQSFLGYLDFHYFVEALPGVH